MIRLCCCRRPDDFVPAGHLSRFAVALVMEELDFSGILASYQGEKGQPPYHPAMMVALLLAMRSASIPRAGSLGRYGAGRFHGDRGVAGARLSAGLTSVPRAASSARRVRCCFLSTGPKRSLMALGHA